MMESVQRVPVVDLVLGESPRLIAEDEAHISRLSETSDELPPIVVHRQSMRIIDGMHRYRAAILKQQVSIAVRFFDGSEDEAYIYGIRANVTHGLPLTLAERKAAAEHIIRIRPQLSDRAVACVTGLSSKTAGAIRRRSSEENTQLNVRVGLDGRSRPVNSEEVRRRALEVIRSRPGASVREIARVAGVSVGTAHSLRTRVGKGEDLEPDINAGSSRDPALRTVGCRGMEVTADDSPADGDAEEPPDVGTVVPVREQRARRGRVQTLPVGSASRIFARLESLQRDPSLRFTERGRTLLVWLRRRVITVAEGERELSDIPAHLVPVIAGLAIECADEWRQLANELQGRMDQVGP